VEVARVDLERRELDFRLVQKQGVAQPAKKTSTKKSTTAIKSDKSAKKSPQKMKKQRNSKKRLPKNRGQSSV